MNAHKNSMMIIAIIVVIAFSVLFFIVNITSLFVIAYIFALLGIAGILFSGLLLLKAPHDYPWVAAISLRVITWFVAETIISMVFVVLEQLGIFALNGTWFLLMQLVILAFFVGSVIILNAGRVEINRIDTEVYENAFEWKALITDIEALAAKNPDIIPVLDAIRYSDPIINPQIAKYDAKIRGEVNELERAIDGEGDVMELVARILLKIKDRNNEIKTMKRG